MEQALGELAGKLNTYQLKRKEQITERVEKLLDAHRARDFYHIELLPVQERRTRQIGKGRPGKHTRYTTTETTLYSLAWSRNQKALEQYQDELTSTQKDVLPLLGMTVEDYWGNLI